MSAESNPSESNFTPGMLPGNPEDYGVVKPKPEEGYNLRTLNEAGDKADADFATGKITADEYSKILHDHLEKLPNVIDDKKRIKEDREMVERLVAEAKAKSAKAGEGSGVLDATVPKPETKPADTVAVASTETDPKIVTSEPHEEGSEVDPIGNVIKPPETEALSAVVAPEPTPEAAPKPAVDAKKVEPVPEQEKPKEDEVAMRNRLREEAEKKFQAEVDKNPEALEKDNFLITGTNKYLKDLEWRKKRWPGIFNDAYSKLTPEEKDKFDVLPYKNKFLNKDQIGHLLVAGYSLEEIEKIKPHWWSNKVTSRLSDKPVYEEELNVLIWQAVNKKFEEIVDFSGVEKFLDTPVKHYSSGMYVRLAFAVAAHLDSQILIVDEVLAVGDAEFQKKCLGKMDSMSKKEGRTVLFVSHNSEAIKKLCNRCILLEKGRKIYEGDVKKTMEKYAMMQARINSNINK